MGHFESRNRALEAIKSGSVQVNQKIAKASQKVDANSEIRVQDEKFYVSRAAKKLEGFLAEYPVQIAGKKVLDIGSSTGGFAQIILEHSPALLVCVDVGSNQLHHSIREQKVVRVFEETDIREFNQSGFEIVTCDVSFISIEQIMDDIDRVSSQSSDIIILYKPQFEVGKDAKRDSKGVVLDQEIIRDKMAGFKQHANDMGWMITNSSYSKLSGKEGNQEYMFHFKKAVNGQ